MKKQLIALICTLSLLATLPLQAATISAPTIPNATATVDIAAGATVVARDGTILTVDNPGNVVVSIREVVPVTKSSKVFAEGVRDYVRGKGGEGKLCRCGVCEDCIPPIPLPDCRICFDYDCPFAMRCHRVAESNIIWVWLNTDNEDTVQSFNDFLNENKDKMEVSFYSVSTYNIPQVTLNLTITPSIENMWEIIRLLNKHESIFQIDVMFYEVWE